MTADGPGARTRGRVYIIGGRLRGSRLTVASKAGLRPTPQRLRQTLFDWLAPVIAGAKVLDAFAGSGALGIEALSRGARAVTFVEHDPRQAQAIEADLVRLHQPGGTVRCADTLGLLAGPAADRYDVAFLDPPFEARLWESAALRLDGSGWLVASAWVYVEAADTAVWAAPAGWHVHRQRVVGAVRGALFRVGTE